MATSVGPTGDRVPKKSFDRRIVSKPLPGATSDEQAQAIFKEPIKPPSSIMTKSLQSIAISGTSGGSGSTIMDATINSGSLSLTDSSVTPGGSNPPARSGSSVISRVSPRSVPGSRGESFGDLSAFNRDGQRTKSETPIPPRLELQRSPRRGEVPQIPDRSRTTIISRRDEILVANAVKYLQYFYAKPVRVIDAEVDNFMRGIAQNSSYFQEVKEEIQRLKQSGSNEITISPKMREFMAFCQQIENLEKQGAQSQDISVYPDLLLVFAKLGEPGSRHEDLHAQTDLYRYILAKFIQPKTTANTHEEEEIKHTQDTLNLLQQLHNKAGINRKLQSTIETAIRTNNISIHSFGRVSEPVFQRNPYGTEEKRRLPFFLPSDYYARFKDKTEERELPETDSESTVSEGFDDLASQAKSLFTGYNISLTSQIDGYFAETLPDRLSASSMAIRDFEMATGPLAEQYVGGDSFQDFSSFLYLLTPEYHQAKEAGLNNTARVIIRSAIDYFTAHLSSAGSSARLHEFLSAIYEQEEIHQKFIPFLKEIEDELAKAERIRAVIQPSVSAESTAVVADEETASGMLPPSVPASIDSSVSSDTTDPRKQLLGLLRLHEQILVAPEVSEEEDQEIQQAFKERLDQLLVKKAEIEIKKQALEGKTAEALSAAKTEYKNTLQLVKQEIEQLIHPQYLPGTTVKVETANETQRLLWSISEKLHAIPRSGASTERKAIQKQIQSVIDLYGDIQKKLAELEPKPEEPIRGETPVSSRLGETPEQA